MAWDKKARAFAQKHSIKYRQAVDALEMIKSGVPEAAAIERATVSNVETGGVATGIPMLASSNPVRMIEAAQTFVLAAGGNVENARKALDTYEQFNKLLNPPSTNGAASDASKAAAATHAASK